MAFSQSVTAIIIFWAIVGGLGASLLLPAMQSLIHGNFEGAAQRKAYALVRAAAAIAAAVGPLIGGFITTYLSWRIAFLLEVVIIAVVLSGRKLVHDVAYTGPRQIDLVGAVLSVVGMGGIVLGILVWQEGGEAVGAFLAVGAASLAGFGFWLVRRKRQGKPTLITEARPLALQLALVIPILAGPLGLLNSFRMMRVPEPPPSSSVDAAAFG
jgi:LPXTG-motif cell wall-anchored protein